MKAKWPTLQGRLKYPLKDNKTALEQLQRVLPLSKIGKKLYDKLSNKKS